MLGGEVSSVCRWFCTSTLFVSVTKPYITGLHQMLLTKHSPVSQTQACMQAVVPPTLGNSQGSLSGSVSSTRGYEKDLQVPCFQKTWLSLFIIHKYKTQRYHELTFLFDGTSVYLLAKQYISLHGCQSSGMCESHGLSCSWYAYPSAFVSARLARHLHRENHNTKPETLSK